MTPRRRMSENERTIFVCLLFPIFWPFLPAVLVCIAAEKIRDAWWDWKFRRAEKRETPPQEPGQ